MTKVLSQGEINQLLATINADDPTYTPKNSTENLSQEELDQILNRTDSDDSENASGKKPIGAKEINMDNNELKKLHGRAIESPGKKRRLVIGSFNAKVKNKDGNFVVCQDLSVNDLKNSIKFIQIYLRDGKTICRDIEGTDEQTLFQTYLIPALSQAIVEYTGKFKRNPNDDMAKTLLNIVRTIRNMVNFDIIEKYDPAVMDFFISEFEKVDTEIKTIPAAGFSELLALDSASTQSSKPAKSALQQLADLASIQTQKTAARARQRAEDSANEARQMAESMRITDLDQAIVEYTEALRRSPNDASAKANLTSVYYIRGLTFESKSENAWAVEEYSEAIKINPDYSLALKKRGAASREAGNYDQVIKDYGKLLQLNPNDAEAKQNLASAYRHRVKLNDREYDYARAIEDFEMALKYNPDDDYSRDLLEVVKADMKNLTELIGTIISFGNGKKYKILIGKKFDRNYFLAFPLVKPDELEEIVVLNLSAGYVGELVERKYKSVGITYKLAGEEYNGNDYQEIFRGLLDEVMKKVTQQ